MSGDQSTMTSKTTTDQSEDKAESPQTALDWAMYLRERAADATTAGNASVATRLEALAHQMEKGSWDNYLAFERESQVAKIRDWEDQWKHSRAWQIENQRQVIGLGQSAIRWFAVINAGAVVALLAFLGNVWTKGVVLGPFLTAMGTFAFGVVLAALAGALSYLTQLQYGAESDRAQTSAKVLHAVTIVVGLGSLVVFCMGSYRTVDAFQEQSVQPTKISAAVEQSTGDPERRNYPPPKKPPSEPPRPSAPVPPRDTPKPAERK